jgi:hypothetical protein
LDLRGKQTRWNGAHKQPGRFQLQMLQWSAVLVPLDWVLADGRAWDPSRVPGTL